MGKTAGSSPLSSLQVPQTSLTTLPPLTACLLLHPVLVILNIFQGTQLCPQENSLLSFYTLQQGPLCTLSNVTSSYPLAALHWGSSHLYKWPKSPPLFQQMQIKFAARSDGNMSGSTLMSASCLGHGSSIFASSLLKNNHSE